MKHLLDKYNLDAQHNDKYVKMMFWGNYLHRLTRKDKKK